MYDDDILEWSEQQASALRDLQRRRQDLSNELDWEHIAEEIEDVGRSELASVQSWVRQILLHLVKAASVSDPHLTMSWRKGAVAFHSDLLDRVTPSMLPRIDMEKVWQRAITQAEADLAAHGQAIAPNLPRGCPLDVTEIVDQNFDFLRAVESVRKTMNAD